jgi:hypothetical protein
MSNEVFELLDKQKKESGITYWACRPCTVFAQGMNHRLKQIDDDIKELKQNTATNTESIQNIEKKVEEIAVQVKKNDGITKSDLEARLREEKDEARERKDRELNVIIHGIEECDDEAASNEERRGWDVGMCLDLFSSQNINVRESDIKFCRRVGQRREKERPVVLGLFNQALKSKILRASYGEEVTVGPDMTKKQREEEAEIWKELDQKNKTRTEDQVSKNLMWRMVGPKGERRLVLGPARQQYRAAGAEQQQLQQQPASQQRQTPAPLRGASRGRTLVRGAGRWSTTYRPRLGSKRKEREQAEVDDEEMEDGTREPPPKH